MFLLPLLTNEWFLGGVIIAGALLFGIHMTFGLGRVVRLFSARRRQAHEARAARRAAVEARIKAEEAAVAAKAKADEAEAEAKAAEAKAKKNKKPAA